MHKERSQYDPPKVLEKYQLKALPTIYGGINYRSRIEARWAVFFDTLGLAHEYEREGFDLGDGQLYLPDFWLPAQKFWVEIKGEDPNEDACDKAHRLAVASGFPVFVFYGGHVVPSDTQSPPKAYAFFSDGAGDSEYLWCECSSCGSLGIEFDGRSDRLPCKQCYRCWSAKRPVSVLEQFNAAFNQAEKVCDCGSCPRTGGNGDKGYNYASSRLCKAYSASRAIRFGR